MKRRCIWCPAELDIIDGELHEYIESTPECWNTFNLVLRREMQNYIVLGGTNRLTADTYAVQHPGVPSRKSTQSVIGHLVSLYHIFEKNVSMEQATRILGTFISRKYDLKWLNPPDFIHTLHIGQVLGAESLEEHKKLVHQWAESVWLAWKDVHFDRIKYWADKI